MDWMSLFVCWASICVISVWADAMVKWCRAIAHLTELTSEHLGELENRVERLERRGDSSGGSGK